MHNAVTIFCVEIVRMTARKRTSSHELRHWSWHLTPHFKHMNNEYWIRFTIERWHTVVLATITKFVCHAGIIVHALPRINLVSYTIHIRQVKETNYKPQNLAFLVQRDRSTAVEESRLPARHEWRRVIVHWVTATIQKHQSVNKY